MTKMWIRARVYWRVYSADAIEPVSYTHLICLCNFMNVNWNNKGNKTWVLNFFINEMSKNVEMSGLIEVEGMELTISRGSVTKIQSTGNNRQWRKVLSPLYNNIYLKLITYLVDTINQITSMCNQTRGFYMWKHRNSQMLTWKLQFLQLHYINNLFCPIIVYCGPYYTAMSSVCLLYTSRCV